MIPVIISGACGRMGKIILTCALESEEIKIIGALEAPGHPALGKTLSEALGLAGEDMVITSDASKYEEERPALIEFTSPEATMDHLHRAKELGWAMVIGTTALDENQQAKIKQAAEKVPIVFASNMSVGVNLLFKLVSQAASVLGDSYDAEVFEVHHRFKKDAPSGTAKTIAETIAHVRNLDPEKGIVYGRKGIIGERKEDEIGVHALRAGDVVGEHTVVFATLGERVELTHRCHSRRTFALGALRAALFLAGKSSGLYTMQDVLGIR